MTVHYRTLRQLIGVLGLLLPVAMVAGSALAGERPLVRDSISAYHASAVRDVFVGLVFSVGVFLFAYRGYDGDVVSDDWLGNIGSASAA